MQDRHQLFVSLTTGDYSSDIPREVGDFIFGYDTGSFQNNNSVLPPFTKYVLGGFFPPSATEPMESLPGELQAFL